MATGTKQRGLTLIELFIGLALTAIVLAMAVPSYRNLIAGAQRSSVITEIGTSLLYGRSEAVKRSATVSLCPSNDGVTCAGGGAPEWNGGWIVFLDANGDKIVDAGDTVLRAHAFDNPSYTLTGSNGMELGVTFRSSGFTDDPGQLDYSDHDGSHPQRIELNAAGRMRVVRL